MIGERIRPGAQKTRAHTFAVAFRRRRSGTSNVLDSVEQIPTSIQVVDTPEAARTLSEIKSVARRVLMEYSPGNAIPYVSRVDGGTLDLVRSFGIDVLSSADALASVSAQTWTYLGWDLMPYAPVCVTGVYSGSGSFFVPLLCRGAAVQECGGLRR